MESGKKIIQKDGSAWTFAQNGNGSYFTMKIDDMVNSYYFPISNERLKASITPLMGGDSSLDINSFLLKPMTEEELMSSTYTRNFWLKFDDGEIWSATGNSVKQKMNKDEDVVVKGGFLYHEVERKNSKLGVKSTITNFVPSSDDAVELMRVTIKNICENSRKFEGIVAIPIYGRSADNIRDHNHVTSLLHRTKITENGLVVEPTLSFDERGHVKNHIKYQVFAINEEGDNPVDIVPVVEDFVGGGSFDWPDYVVCDVKPQEYSPRETHGRHTIAGLKFKEIELKPSEEFSYYIMMGIDDNELSYSNFILPEKFEALFTQTKLYWQNKADAIQFNTASPFMDQWLQWVSIQPVLRRIYGNSFLPHHDYGRGGRGWRDLWQDILSLILIENKEVRTLLLSNFAGVRLDGSNATVIGSNPGEFKADRNNIPRVWMDHGTWPIYTTNFYIDQTGDVDILFEEQSYFNDQFTHRCRQTNPNYVESLGTRLKTSENKVHFSTVFEHLLVQNLTSSFNVGMNNNILLEGGDWNDALDMARDFGESVAFTSFYANNLRTLVDLLELIKERKDMNSIKLTTELHKLIDFELDLTNPNAKKKLLSNYFDIIADGISGEFEEIEIDVLIEYLTKIADHIISHLNENEVITNSEGYQWYNGYYDNFGDQVEGDHPKGVRMTLTGQTFPLLTKIVDEEKIDEIIKSVDHYLVDPKVGGPRLNTDFKEVKLSLGRAFGFAYGHKENGAMFSHMSMMYAFGLYLNDRPEKGYEVLSMIFEHLQKTDKSMIYPNLPEYINEQGRGMYSFLTGSASWLIYLLVTQVYGLRGRLGNLVVNPKLLSSQFGDDDRTRLISIFRNINVDVTYVNESGKDFGEYLISSYKINGEVVKLDEAAEEIELTHDQLLDKIDDGDVRLEIILE